MKLLQRQGYEVIRAVLLDCIFEGGELIADDDTVAAVRLGDWVKCAFAPGADVDECIAKYALGDRLCALGITSVPRGYKASDPCTSFAYLAPLPPAADAADIRRLAPTLAGLVADSYRHHDGGITSAEAEQLIRTKGVFGAFIDSKLAGFIGRHEDGTMGMLTVFDGYRRRGVGEKLERFMINYVMTFGRVPVCDVYTDNLPSLELQHKLGLTANTVGLTYWLYK